MLRNDKWKQPREKIFSQHLEVLSETEPIFSDFVRNNQKRAVRDTTLNYMNGFVLTQTNIFTDSERQIFKTNLADEFDKRYGEKT